MVITGTTCVERGVFRGNTETAHDGGTTVTVGLSHFPTRGPGKEHGTNKPPPSGRVQEKSKGAPGALPPPRTLPGIHLGQVTHESPGTPGTE